VRPAHHLRTFLENYSLVLADRAFFVGKVVVWWGSIKILKYQKNGRAGVSPATPGDQKDALVGGRDARPTGKNMTEPPEEELVIYRRRMPHWRLAGSVYFVTWRLTPPQTELTTDERGIIMSALKHFDNHRYEL